MKNKSLLPLYNGPTSANLTKGAAVEAAFGHGLDAWLCGYQNKFWPIGDQRRPRY